jgi:hypothetical protein
MHTTRILKLNPRRGLALGVAALALGGAVTGAAADTASASALSYRTHLTDLSTGFRLDSNAAGVVYTLPANTGFNQVWAAYPSSYGTVTLVNWGTGRCLDSDVFGDVYTHVCNTGNFQKWIVLQRNYGTVVLRDLATGLVLDSNSSRDVYTQPENGGNYQKWVPSDAS